MCSGLKPIYSYNGSATCSTNRKQYYAWHCILISTVVIDYWGGNLGLELDYYNILQLVALLPFMGSTHSELNRNRAIEWKQLYICWQVGELYLILVLMQSCSLAVSCINQSSMEDYLRRCWKSYLAQFHSAANIVLHNSAIKQKWARYHSQVVQASYHNMYMCTNRVPVVLSSALSVLQVLFMIATLCPICTPPTLKHPWLKVITLILPIYQRKRKT